MENNVFLSIIIPMYNSEKTISKCLDSIYNSNYPRKKYEVIVVDVTLSGTSHVIYVFSNIG